MCALHADSRFLVSAILKNFSTIDKTPLSFMHTHMGRPEYGLITATF